MFKTRKSSQLFKSAQNLLVGGVNSPVRAFKSVGGDPIFVQKGKGAYFWDADGNKYTDFVSSWGPLILGHAYPPIVSKIKQQAAKGSSFGAPTDLEVEMAKLVCHAIPSIEKVRFVSSGTEAAMSAIRLARGYTKRDKIIKFAGCYHGHSDGLLVKAGSGATTLGIPDSAGVPNSYSQQTLVLPYNNSQAVEECFNAHGEEIAAIIVEPIAANMGVILPQQGFLETLRKLTQKWGALLIFDEVITGFRISYGGAQEHLRIRPDITCLGKIIGGGLPVGAFGGSRKIMEHLAPIGPVYQAGTLSGNPLAMAAGIETLSQLKKLNPYKKLEKLTQKFIQSLQNEVQINQIGSMFTLFFSDQPVTDYTSALQANTKLYAQFFHKLLEEGIYFPPSQFEAAFISCAHDEALLEKISHKILKTLRSLPHA